MQNKNEGDLGNFNIAYLLLKAMDYSAFANYKNSVRFDAKLCQLDDAIDEAGKLERRVRKLHGKGSSDNIASVVSELKAERRKVIEENPGYASSYGIKV
jgi:hypothetical protein